VIFGLPLGLKEIRVKYGEVGTLVRKIIWKTAMSILKSSSGGGFEPDNIKKLMFLYLFKNGVIYDADKVENLRNRKSGTYGSSSNL
jgi:hypothetical protein